MNGSMQLSDEEQQEMIQDAQDPRRGKAFLALKVRCHTGTLDEYIEFLSENIGSFNFFPSKKISDHNKL
jgi:hypothetical protein